MKEFDAINTLFLLYQSILNTLTPDGETHLSTMVLAQLISRNRSAHTICKDYACQSQKEYRATYIIDPEGYIRSMQINEAVVKH